MRGAALADLHLGFRQFQATTEGRNAREVDVEQAWLEAVDGVVEAEPDLVTIAGDIFHHPRVSDFAKRAFLRGIAKILDRTQAHIVVLQGNHDAGRTAEVLTPIALANVLDGKLYVVTEPKRIGFWTRGNEKDERVSVACFPYVARGKDVTYALEPDPTADVNVLLMHAAVRGDVGGDRLPYFYGGDQALDVGREAERWGVIACGDYHEFTRLHPTRLAFYSGSLERTSSNIWDEHAPKGWVKYDTASQAMELVEVPTRRVLDIFTTADHPAGINATLQALPTFEDLDGIVMRLKVEDFPRAEKGGIDWALVREIKSKALHFQLDLHYAERVVTDLGDGRERGRSLSLAEEAVRFFAEDGQDVRDCAMDFLELHADAEVVEREAVA